MQKLLQRQRRLEVKTIIECFTQIQQNSAASSRPIRTAAKTSVIPKSPRMGARHAQNGGVCVMQRGAAFPAFWAR
jgi:hypothetical protein